MNDLNSWDLRSLFNSCVLFNASEASSGKNITARPAKIVAGLEVEKTLELLEIIGLTIDSNVMHFSLTRSI